MKEFLVLSAFFAVMIIATASPAPKTHEPPRETPTGNADARPGKVMLAALR